MVSIKKENTVISSRLVKIKRILKQTKKGSHSYKSLKEERKTLHKKKFLMRQKIIELNGIRLNVKLLSYYNKGIDSAEAIVLSKATENMTPEEIKENRLYIEKKIE